MKFELLSESGFDSIDEAHAFARFLKTQKIPCRVCILLPEGGFAHLEVAASKRQLARSLRSAWYACRNWDSEQQDAERVEIQPREHLEKYVADYGLTDLARNMLDAARSANGVSPWDFAPGVVSRLKKLEYIVKIDGRYRITPEGVQAYPKVVAS
jgi:hypothetical protein